MTQDYVPVFSSPVISVLVTHWTGGIKTEDPGLSSLSSLILPYLYVLLTWTGGSDSGFPVFYSSVIPAYLTRSDRWH